MLKPKQIDELPEALIELYSQVEMDIITDMARRISGMDYFIPAAQWQYRKLIEMGNCHGWIMQALSAQTGKGRREIERMMEEAGFKAIRQDAAIYKRAGLSPPELTASPSLQDVLKDGIRNTKGLFENLTNTTANTATRQFERALDRAWLQVQSGVFSQEEAIRTAIKDLSEKGVECITYPSGHVDHMDVAVRRAAVTGANQVALRMQDALADEMGSDLVETTAHSGARPEHALWQGKIFSRSGTHPKYPDFRSSTGYGTGLGLGGFNCRHSFFPFFEGISDPAYTQVELDEMNAPKYTYNGEKLTEYEASQKQRTIERNIRRWKREYKAMEVTGLDTSEAFAKLSRWQKKQKDFLSQTGLKRQPEREQAEGFGRREAARAREIVKKQEIWYNQKQEEARRLIRSEETVKTLNVGNQLKHIHGAGGRYIDGRSYLYGSMEDAQALVKRYAGTGEPVLFRGTGEWKYKEVVTAEEDIGVVVDPETREEVSTNRFTIHYGKNGTHIVPTRRHKT